MRPTPDPTWTYPLIYGNALPVQRTHNCGDGEQRHN